MGIKLWNRAGVGIALIFIAVLVVVLLVQAGPISARGGPKPQPTELKAYLRGADTGDKIYSDYPGVPYISNRDTASYPNNVIFLASGTLYMRIQKNRRVYFNFDIAGLSYPGTSTFAPGNDKVTCHGYSVDGLSGDVFTLNTPAFIKDGGTVTLTNDITFISTGAVVQYVPPAKPGALGSWVADPTIPPPTIPTMSVGDTLYVWLSISFDTTDENESFYVYHNYEMWRGLSPRTGIAMVTHPYSDIWVLEPLRADDTEHPLRALGWNDASLSMVVSRDVQAGHPGGYCDLGYWNMPFELTLKKR